jgi:uncharacterized protein (DUF433 family)
MQVASSSRGHRSVDEQGLPVIAGTIIKVVKLVMAQMAHGWSPEELHFQFPNLSMSRVHSVVVGRGQVL